VRSEDEREGASARLEKGKTKKKHSRQGETLPVNIMKKPEREELNRGDGGLHIFKKGGIGKKGQYTAKKGTSMHKGKPGELRRDKLSISSNQRLGWAARSQGKMGRSGRKLIVMWEPIDRRKTGEKKSQEKTRAPILDTIGLNRQGGGKKVESGGEEGGAIREGMWRHVSEMPRQEQEEN